MARPILPVRLQTSIVGRNELNYRVRNGNGCTLALIGTNFVGVDFVSFATAQARSLTHSVTPPLPREPAYAGLRSEKDGRTSSAWTSHHSRPRKRDLSLASSRLLFLANPLTLGFARRRTGERISAGEISRPFREYLSHSRTKAAAAKRKRKERHCQIVRKDRINSVVSF